PRPRASGRIDGPAGLPRHLGEGASEVAARPGRARPTRVPRPSRGGPMTLAPELLDILVCPKCQGDLEYRQAEAVLGCPACRLAGVSLDGLAEELLTGLPVAQGTPSGPPPMSRFAERAVQEAGRQGGGLLPILLRSPKGRIASVLSRRGAKLDELRRALAPAEV